VLNRMGIKITIGAFTHAPGDVNIERKGWQAGEFRHNVTHY
jgi:hypothetical protein